MRPKERIDMFLKEIKAEWYKTPDLRFIQFLNYKGIDFNDFNMEDEKFILKVNDKLKVRDILFIPIKDGKKIKNKLLRTCTVEELQKSIHIQRESDMIFILNELKFKSITNSEE